MALPRVYLFSSGGKRRNLTALVSGSSDIYCVTCGNFSEIAITQANIRESAICCKCGSTNRQRQMSYALNLHLSSLNTDLSTVLTIYNTECSGPVHNSLSQNPGYLCSEYFGREYCSGSTLGGIIHQDLMSTSFSDSVFDVVLSSDVLEHVPDPYMAQKEIYRILKTDGIHIFTVPFDEESYNDKVLASMDKEGNIEYYSAPTYHFDPLRSEGSLVYTIFSFEMLDRLKLIGFSVKMNTFHLPQYGIFNGRVFMTYKK